MWPTCTCSDMQICNWHMHCFSIMTEKPEPLVLHNLPLVSQRSSFIAEGWVTSYMQKSSHLTVAVHPGTPAQCSSAQTLSPGWQSARPRSPVLRNHHQSALESRQTLGHSEPELGLWVSVHVCMYEFVCISKRRIVCMHTCHETLHGRSKLNINPSPFFHLPPLFHLLCICSKGSFTSNTLVSAVQTGFSKTGLEYWNGLNCCKSIFLISQLFRKWLLSRFTNLFYALLTCLGILSQSLA